MAKKKQTGFGAYPIKMAALGMLVDEPKHGYELYQDFVEKFGLIWKAGQAKFYVALTALEEAGHLHVTEEPQPSRPTRKVYHLTESGREQFLTWLAMPVPSMRAIRVEFLAKLRFFRLLDLPGSEDLLNRQIALFEGMIDEWRTAIAASTHSDPFEPLIHDYRIRQAEAIIGWMHDNREQFS